jgi:hypothetical protein
MLIQLEDDELDDIDTDDASPERLAAACIALARQIERLELYWPRCRRCSGMSN